MKQYDSKAEMAVLGAAILMNQPDRLFSMLTRDSFWVPAHQMIWDAIVEVVEGFGVPDFIALSGVLERNGNLKAVGGEAYLLSLAESVSSTSNWAYHARIVQGWYECRVLSSRAEEIIQLAQDGNGKGAKATALSMLDGLSSDGRSTFTAEESLRDAENRPTEGVITGFSVWDDAGDEFRGMSKGGAHVFAANSGSGKTLVLAETAVNVLENGGRVIFGTFELPHAVITRRMLRMMSGYGSLKLAEKMVQRDPYGPQRFKEAEERFAKFDLHFYDPGTDISRPKTLEPFLDFVRFQHEQKPVDLACLDYIQIVRLANDTRMDDFTRIETVARMAAGHAQRWNYTSLLAAQSKVHDGEPYLRGSKSVKDHVDSLVYKVLVKPKSEPPYHVFNCDKQRHGKQLDVVVELDQRTLRHKELGSA